jgi:rubrerythrin
VVKFGLLLAILCLLFPAADAAAQSAWPETVFVIQSALKGELLAHARYVAYAEKAREEKYPHIANLALALATSEGVHARNFQQVLKSLGSPADMTSPVVPVADTRTNLKTASTTELEEIDNRYPKFIARITPEKCTEAVSDLTHAWQSEKQHRELITQLLSGSGLLFGVLARTIEKTPVDYFVCDRCGSTLPELPKDTCPICAGPVSNYRKVDTGS